MKIKFIALVVGFSFIAAGKCFAAIELNILCWQGYAPQLYVSGFEQYIEKKHGKKVKVIVKNVSDPQEFFNGLRSKAVDIISPAHNIPKSERWPMIQKHLVLPLNLKNIPNYKNVNPYLQHASYVSKAEQLFGVPIVYGTYGLAYNSNKLTKAPTSWSVLWQPEYVGKFSISADYYEANIYSTALSLGYTGEQLYDYDLLSKDPVFIDRLSRLANSTASLWHGVDKSADLLGLSLATAWGFSFQELRKKGEVWRFSSPTEGVTGWVDHWLIGYSLKDDAFKKMLAEEWINFTLSEEMQTYYVRALGQYPVSTAINKHLTTDEIAKFHLDNSDYIKDNLNLWKVLSIRQQNGFRLLWQRAKGTDFSGK